MPTWCANEVVFRGSDEECAAFREVMGEARRAFDFEALAPVPSSLTESGARDEKAYLIKYGPLEALESGFHWGALGAEFGPSTYPDREAALQAARHPENAAYWGGRPFDEVADAAYANVLKHGHAFWYDWACHNWGTKWNVAEGEAEWKSSVGEVRVVFPTAWAPPFPILRLISERFREAEIVVDYYGIDDPSMNAGKIVFSCGEETSWEDIPAGDPRHPWAEWLAKNPPRNHPL
jgi:hypothetical protein